MNVSDFLNHFDRPRKTSRGFMVQCPGHDDKTPSLSVTEGEDQRILIHCHSGCSTEAILNAMNLKLSDLFSDTPLALSQISACTKRKILSQTIRKVGTSRAAMLLKADRIIEAATGLSIEGWTDQQIDEAIGITHRAHETLWLERLEELQNVG